MQPGEIYECQLMLYRVINLLHFQRKVMQMDKTTIKLLTLLLLISIITPIAVKRDKDKEEVYIHSLLARYKLDIPEVFEYAHETVDLNRYIASRPYKPDVPITETGLNEQEDLSTLGQRQVELLVSAEDKYGRLYNKSVSGLFEVTDTQYPVIEMSETSIAVTEGTSIDPNDYVIQVYDPIDGTMNVASAEESGTYWFEGYLNTDKPGQYSIDVIAEDVNGNRSSETLTVIVKNKPKPTVNFDSEFTTISANVYNMQSLLDSGNIILYCGDYFHHNSRSFMNLFNKCKAGVKVILNGHTYTSGGIFHGYCTDQDIYYDNGNIAWDGNSVTELITCDGSPGTYKRWILVLY